MSSFEDEEEEEEEEDDFYQDCLFAMREIAKVLTRKKQPTPETVMEQKKHIGSLK